MARKSKAQKTFESLPLSVLSGLSSLCRGDLVEAYHKNAFWTGTACTASQARRLESEGCVKILDSVPWGRGERLEIKSMDLGRKVAAL